jgi:putative CocE/NonD family hydrolase
MSSHLPPALTLAAASVLSAAPAVLPAKYPVKTERAVMIPMRDGKRLSADIFRPDAPGQFPVIVMYHPYRKDDVGRGGVGEHFYFAERGFASVRLDARGTGTSEGVTTDEYRLEEQLDGVDAVEWLARRPWANGNVGMYGVSYSGFTAIQVALHQPPSLKAIVPLYATDDRYTDDCHYDRGGNLRLYYDVGTYGNSMIAMNALPPQPELAGSRWTEIWKERLEHNQPYLLEWIKHPVDGPYWRNGSLRPGYDRLRIPVYLIAGWHDGYVNAMLRMYTRLTGPRKLLIGPWVHTPPHASRPGPRIDWINEAARFFAHWLRGEDSGIMREPPVTVYMQQPAKPDRRMNDIPGFWRNDAAFPVAGSSELVFYLAEGGLLAERAGTAGVDEFEYRPTTGIQNAFWSAGGIRHYLAADQRADEAYAAVYTSAPVAEDTQLLGWPKVILQGSSSAPVATFVAKLASVAPDGQSSLITDGALNGTRRASLTDPEPMRPGEVYELAIPMAPAGWVIPKGHRLRLAVSGGDFPNLWPTPYPATNRIHRGGRRDSRVVLPVAPAATLPPPAFLPPPVLHQIVTPVAGSGKPPLQQIVLDHLANTATMVYRSSGGSNLDENMGAVFSEAEFQATVSDDDPAKASIVGRHTYTFRREDGAIEVTAESSIRSTETDFHVTIQLLVTRNGLPFFQKQWLHSQPRRLL